MTVGFANLGVKSRKPVKGKRGGPGRFVTLKSGRVIFISDERHKRRAKANRLGLGAGEVGYAVTSRTEFVEVLGDKLPSKYAAYVTRYTPAEYREMGARCYLSETRNSGFAIKPDGDVISVFSRPGGKEGKWAVWAAIANGGKKLDCFDGFLAKEFYPAFGFKEYDRWKWDDRYAPEGWDYERNGRPDVVLMRLREG